MNESKIILFDGVCNFCNFFKFAALQSEAGLALLKKFKLSTNDFDTFILIDGENYFTKSTAALKIAKKLKGSVKLFYPFIVLPKFLRDFFYGLIAKNRYKFFGKRDVCRIPTEKERDKFL